VNVRWITTERPGGGIVIATDGYEPRSRPPRPGTAQAGRVLVAGRTRLNGVRPPERARRVVIVTMTRDGDSLDVDVRFLLANERTLLAWLRTALTLLAGGVALAQFAGGRPVMAAVGVALLALGSVAAVVGYLRYRAAGRAIRAGRLPEPGRGPALLSGGVVALAVVLVLIYAVGR